MEVPRFDFLEKMSPSLWFGSSETYIVGKYISEPMMWKL